MKSFEQLLKDIGEFGVVEQIRYPLIVATGLPNVRVEELVVFENEAVGQVFFVERDQVEILLLSTEEIQAGTRVARTTEFFHVPVGTALLGGIIDPLGNSISKEYVVPKLSEKREINVAPAGISKRAKIKKPFMTGVMVVDTMIPLGRGQKELVIGDRKTGKTSFILSTIKHQVKENTVAIYAGIAKKKSDIKKIEEFFKKEGIIDHTIIVATTSNDSPSLTFLTPYAAMSIAEYFRDQGRDVLVILDDLSTHAKFYREISLLAKRFPGRDSYPGDIFYVHSRLLERTGNFKVQRLASSVQRLEEEKQEDEESESQSGIESESMNTTNTTNAKSQISNKSGNYQEVSITALPVVELVEGDFTGYIATNLMSMTDGHIYFDSDIYYQGRRPAVNIPLSVTRVGKQVHSGVLRAINRELSTLFVLYDRMQNLSHFGAELSESVLHVLQTGEIFYKFFNQPYTVTVPVEVLLAMIGIIWLKFYDETNTDSVHTYLTGLLAAYTAGQGKELFSDFIKAENFNDLLSKVSSHRDELIKLCHYDQQSGVVR